MASEVYFAKAGGRLKQGPLDKIRMLFDAAGFGEIIEEKDLVAVKTHFGERGNTSYVPIPYVRTVVEEINKCGGKPFLTDTGCLYLSSRYNARDHLIVAEEHGFGLSSTLAPVLIADGLRGTDVIKVPVNLKHFESVEVAGAIHDANALVVISHFTGHGLTGFGATIKNIGMGAAGRRMKLAVHDAVRPSVIDEKCDLCASCLENCPTGAISVKNGKIVVDKAVCYGCGECIGICPAKAMKVFWVGNPKEAQEKLAEITYGVLKEKRGKAGFFNFLINITPTCDCWNYSAAPMVPDIGFLASKDPVAIDAASVDLVNEAALQHSPNNRGCLSREKDIIHAKFQVDWRVQIDYAEKIGLGSSTYKIINVGD